MKSGHIFKLLVPLYFIMNRSFAGFTEFPQTRNVTAGSEVEFRCQHSEADFIGWRVNNVSVRNSPLPGVSQSQAGTALTILALPEYNGTVVECVALFLDGSQPEYSPPVYLIVEGNCNSTVAIAFIEEPESQNVAIGETAEFRCRHPTADYIAWTINGTSLNNLNPNNISTTSILLPGGHSRYILLIGAIPTYNGTIVICVAAFVNECPSQQSGPAVLLIQGPLLAVTALVRGFISDQTFSWNPPPTLDLTNVEPDIAYCVIIHNITCGRNDFLIGDCGRTDPFYIYEDIHPGHVYSILVIPRSNVDRALNGTPLFLEETFVSYQVENINLIKEDNSLNISVVLEIAPNTSNSISGYRIVPDMYDVIVTATDGIDNMPTTVSQRLRGDVHNLTFTLEGKRIWKYEFFAYGCKQHSLGNISISTHDAYNILVTSPDPGVVMVTGNFIVGASAKGVLIIMYSLTNDSDILYVTSDAHQQGGINANLGINNYGTYEVAVFTLERTGLPFPRVAALPQVVKHEPKGGAVDSNAGAIPTKIKYELHPNSTGVCITCIFLESSATDCVAVVHQRISQLSSSGLMNIESSHKFTRSGDTAYGCIKGVIYGDMKYQIGVVGGEKASQELDVVHTEGVSPHPISTTDIVVIVISIILLVVITVATAILVVVMWRCNTISSKPFTAGIRLRRIGGEPIHQPLNANYLHEDPNQTVIAQNLCLLQPHAAKWRIVANVFGISPDLMVKQETDEAYLHEILVQCVDQPDFQFKFNNLVERLNKEAEDEAKNITKQGAGISLEEEDKKPDNSVVEIGPAERIVIADSLPKDNPSTGATKPSKATTEAAAVTHPIQESGSRAKAYEGVVKEQLRYVNSTGVDKVPEIKSEDIMVRADSPPENANMSGVWNSIEPRSESARRSTRVQQTHRSAPDEDEELPQQPDGIPFPLEHPPFDEDR